MASGTRSQSNSMAAEGGTDPILETLSTAHAEDENEDDTKYIPETVTLSSLRQAFTTWALHAAAEHARAEADALRLALLEANARAQQSSELAVEATAMARERQQSSSRGGTVGPRE